MTADFAHAIVGSRGGHLSRFVSPATEVLNMYAKGFEDLQHARMAAALRGDDWLAAVLKKDEEAASRRLGKALKEHELWPFLQPLKGLAGPRTARVIAEIGDPRRFPGQRCTEGHYLPAIYPAGIPCPVSGERDALGEIVREDALAGPLSLTADGTPVTDYVSGCQGTLLEPRPHSGVRSLWHYAGLHVVDGKMPRRRVGVQADWKPTLRTLALGPDGLADQIIKHRTPVYRDTYDAVKARKALEDLAPWRIHKIARTRATKHFLGDLLTTWKALHHSATETQQPCG